MTVLLVLYVAAGVLLAILSIPMMLRRLPPNALYGFRVRQTLADPDLWYKLNEHAGKRLFVSGLAIAVGAIIFYLVPGLSLDAYALACLGVTLVFLVIGMGQSFLYLRSLTR